MTRLRLGVDIGGTFTDLVLAADDGRVWSRKLASTPDDYGRAIVEGVRALLALSGVAASGIGEVLHGTTVATNVILEHRGPPTGLLATEGHRDTLEIGRLRYPRLYDLTWAKPPPLVPRRWRLEAAGRLDAAGREVTPLDEEAVRAAVLRLVGEGVETLAIAFLHSYRDDHHERRAGQIAAEVAPALPVTLSSEVLPQIGEYERTSTTVVNAYLRPVLSRYLRGIEQGLGTLGLEAPVLVMQSSGGLMPAGDAARHPVHVVESGPAAGVIAAQELIARLGVPDAITLDMGGTTAKASVIEAGALLRAAEYEVGAGLNIGHRLSRGAGYVLRVPAIDVAEVGAGGGSIVSIDQGGGLQVGPRSAGAVPGPLCYATGGEEPTLTDANLLLGYLNPRALLGGAHRLDRARAEAGFAERIARPLGLELLAAAHGVYRIAVARMVRVVRAVSSERGRDPRGFAIVAFGGNGPLHAAAVAEELGARRIVVPPLPGLFSAVGLLVAEPARHLSRTVLRPLAALEPAEWEDGFRALEALAAAALPGGRLERAADLRYAGQSFELAVSAEPGVALAEVGERFAREHERAYGHRADGDPIEVVHLRVSATLRGEAAPLAPSGQRSGGPTARPAYFGPAHGLIETPVLGRDDVPADGLDGPAIVEEYDATTLVPPGWRARGGVGRTLFLEATS